MNRPIFNEEDLQTLFGPEEKKMSPVVQPAPEKTGETFRVEFKPENQAPIAPLSPGARKFWQPHEVYRTALKTRSKLSIPKLALRFLGIFVLIFVISFTLVNFPALILKLKYFWDTDYRDKPWNTNYIPPKQEQLVSKESALVIPKIRVNVPITWNIDEENTIEQLQNGVVHYKGTALPGQQGNVFITGHSSYYLWAPGSYKDVFALLDQLNAGDKIYIQYEGANFTYEVTNSIVVDPDNLDVLAQSNENILSLMTCVPVGTNLRRLVVTAKQLPS